MCWISTHVTTLMLRFSRPTSDNTDNLWSWYCVLPQVVLWGKGILCHLMAISTTLNLFPSVVSFLSVLYPFLRVVVDLRIYTYFFKESRDLSQKYRNNFMKVQPWCLKISFGCLITVCSMVLRRSGGDVVRKINTHCRVDSRRLICGGGWTRTTELIRGQIYSLLQLPLCDSPLVLRCKNI